jgi:hypothetical protein
MRYFLCIFIPPLKPSGLFLFCVFFVFEVKPTSARTAQPVRCYNEPPQGDFMNKSDVEKEGASIAMPAGGWGPQALGAVAPLISECVFLVEGGAETIFLLRETRGPDAPSRGAAWDAWDGVEATLEIGSFAGVTMRARLRREMVRGAPVCFYEPASTRVRWDLLEKFLEEAFPAVPRCDARNMHQFFSDAPKWAALAQAKELSLAAATVGHAPRRSL